MADAARARAGGAECGVALLLVLWVVGVISVLAAGFGVTARVEQLLARNLLAEVRGGAAAQAGIAAAAQRASTVDPANGWKMDGRPYRLQFEGYDVVVRLQAERGKVDLNRAGGELLAKLFEVLGEPPERAARLADAVQDWRDPDSDRRLHGAEDADYQQAGLPYGAKDGPFDHVNELRLLPGMTDGLFPAVRPLVTVYGSAQVDLASAPGAVLQAATDLAPDTIADIVAAREAHDDETLALLLGGIGAAPAPGSRLFTVRASAAAATGATLFRQATIGLAPGDRRAYLVLDWAESIGPSASARAAGS